ncbi:hypothetical protein FQN50_006819 [Emmonsiellopsis sp. PD_5]|nr:hypothetical protein FQN50_006819 [Emmonsiellopsis sp. PD_5]
MGLAGSSLARRSSRPDPPPYTPGSQPPPYSSLGPPPYSSLGQSSVSGMQQEMPDPFGIQDNNRVVQPQELTSETVLSILYHMAEYLSRSQQQIRLIAIRGVVETIHLRTRDTTPMLIFANYWLNDDPDRAELVLAAVSYAFNQVSASDTNIVFSFRASRNVRQKVTEEALQQDEIIFQDGCLSVFAPPWRYLFCYKVGSMSSLQEYTPEDLQDAALMLYRYLVNSRRDLVPYSEICSWETEFETAALERNIVEQVNSRFKDKFGGDGIAMGQ